MHATPATGNVEITIAIDLTRHQISGVRLLTAREDQEAVLKELAAELLRPTWADRFSRFVSRLKKAGIRNGGNDAT